MIEDFLRWRRDTAQATDAPRLELEIPPRIEGWWGIRLIGPSGTRTAVTSRNQSLLRLSHGAQPLSARRVAAA